MNLFLLLFAVLYVATALVAIFGLCAAASRVMPRPNRRGGRLGRWLQFHGGLR